MALGLVLENVGAEPVEFVNGFLELLVRLTDEQGNDVKTDGLLNFRKLPRIQYHLDPGDALDVEVRVPLSPEDQRSLPVGRYTAVVREYEGSGSFNSVLTSAGVDPPAPLVIVIH